MAAGTQELEQFIREALSRGQTRQAIESALSTAGWPIEQTRSALNAYADVAFPVPVPKPRPHLSAREAFLYLLLFTTLYVSAWNLGNVLFDIINNAYPDPADAFSARYIDSMLWSTASLIIAFPLFLFLARYLSQELVRRPIKRLSAVRRWLTYLTLFIAASVSIGDLICLVYGALSGELTTRFVLKVLVAGAISGAIFGYYLHDLRREETEQ